MQRVVTLTERKLRETARRRDAVVALMPVLAEYARTHGGRFMPFGSAARGTMKYDSDVDILLDFPEDALTEARDFAETACSDLGLKHDLMPCNWCKTAFLDHVAPDLRLAE